MGIPFHDVESTIMRHLEDKQATGEALEDVNINFPGYPYKTKGLEHWCVPNVEENRDPYSRQMQGDGTLLVLIYVQLTTMKRFERGRLCELFSSVLKETTLTIKDYESGNGSNELGKVRFRVGTFGQLPEPEDGLYIGDLTIPFSVTGGT